MFTILPEFEKQYQQYVELGKEYIADKKIIIVGLVRNLQDDLYDNILSIEHLSKHCPNTHYFIYENDSIDNTPELLKYVKQKISNFDYRSDILQLKAFSHIQTKLELKSTERTNNLAQHRNLCLDYIRDSKDNYDFVIVMDIDFKQFNLDGIFNSFGWLSQDYADAIVGNSFELKKVFEHTNNTSLWNYDCWAYRGSWWEDLQKYSHAYHYDPMMWFGFWQPPVGSHPIKVNSAFGGTGIYKTKDITSVQYEGYDCEHVCLHKNLYTKYPNFRLCINPAQIMIFS